MSGFTTTTCPRSVGSYPAHRGHKEWYAEKSDLFIAKPRNRPGPDDVIDNHDVTAAHS